jgi:hypothetical protein
MRKNYFFGFEVKSIDSHIKGTLTECIVNECRNIVSRKVLIDHIVLPLEVFLTMYTSQVFTKETISQSKEFRGFESIYKSLLNPSSLKISGRYKEDIANYRKVFEFSVAILATDNDYARISITTKGAWNYDLGGIVLTKPLLERMIKNINPEVILPTIWTDVEHRMERVKEKIQFSELMKPYKESTINAIDLVPNSPVTVLFSNALKMLIPTLEGVVKDYIILKRIKGIKTANLSTIVGGIQNHKGSAFSNEFKDYLKLALEPIRNLSLHGGAPSESVCNMLVVIVLEMLEEILDKENA